VKFRGDRAQHEYHEKEVECVERPAQEAGDEGIALTPVEQLPLRADSHQNMPY
jgi:hypothetical protein